MLCQTKPLFDDEKPKHVDSFKYRVVRYKELDGAQGAHHGCSSAVSRDRKNMAQVPIKLDELFIRRNVRTGGATRDIRKVVLIGNPGTGKTTRSSFQLNPFIFREDFYF